MKLNTRKDEVIRIETLLTAIDDLPSFVFIIDDADHIVFANKSFYNSTIKFVTDTVRISIEGSNIHRFSGSKMLVDIIVDDVLPPVKRMISQQADKNDFSVSVEVSVGLNKHVFVFRSLKIEVSEKEFHSGLVVSGYTLLQEQINFEGSLVSEAI